ncbi:MAG: tRNA guanosine(34) transglycosylase Tgt [Akkermansiaceae bacterium]
MFELLATDSKSRARYGRLTTPHGRIETPIFMPVGTQGSVKTLHPEDLHALQAQIILGNTYHLWLRPGTEVIGSLGGLHSFTAWDGPMLTDSGGFQVWSLSNLNQISEEGVSFKSHLDGSAMMLTPEKSMEIQAVFGSDIAMLFDECPPYPCERKYAEDSTALTTRWAKRCKDWIEKNKPASGAGRQMHFGIVQGSSYADLREQSARALVDLDFDGYAVGGVSVGEPEGEMFAAIQNAEPFLPATKPRYAMGLGTPTQLLEMIGQGIDLFDCVHPTRCARHGQAFTLDGPIHIKNKQFEFDSAPLTPEAHPHVSRFSRAFLRHSFRAGEIIAQRVLSFHNLYFYLQLMENARAAIRERRFLEFKEEFTLRYQAKGRK